MGDNSSIQSYFNTFDRSKWDKCTELCVSCLCSRRTTQSTWKTGLTTTKYFMFGVLIRRKPVKAQGITQLIILKLMALWREISWN